MKKYYQESKTINVMPTHAYFIPFDNKETVYNDRRTSPNYQDLNGAWKVQEYESILDVADDFYLNTPTDDVEVPSCLQLLGYDQMQYVNAFFPFADNPPYTPNINPTYHYSRYFNVKIDGKKRYLYSNISACGINAIKLLEIE